MPICVDSEIAEPCRRTVKRYNISKDIYKAIELSMNKYLKDIIGMVSLKTDALYSRVCCGYFSLNLHSVDKESVIRNVLLDLVRFRTLHYGNTNSN